MMPFLERQQLGAALLGAPWIYAKTMPQNPHEYTLRKRWVVDADFAAAVAAMRQHGYSERFPPAPARGTAYTMWNVNGWKHWTMGAPVAQTILINRKPTTLHPAPYDSVAERYDALFSDEVSRAENGEIADRIGSLDGLRVLDIGCGTGLLLDAGRGTPERYVGVDPSGPMLAELSRKHQAVNLSTVACRFEDFVDTSGGFDLIVALFGAVSYIDPAFVADVPRLLRPGGRYLLMFYAEGYTPVCYERAGVTVPHAATPAPPPGAACERWNAFVLAEGVKR